MPFIIRFYFIVSLKPKRNPFYKENYIIGEGLDAWDSGVKTFKDWIKKSQNIIKQVKNIKKIA